MKLAAIFMTIGLNAEQIRAATGASVPVKRTPIIDPAKPRPICLVCARPVGKWTCWPGPSAKGGE
jgi:hypothetical protein